MTVHDGDYCIRIEHDADGGVFLALYHGTMPVGFPDAECHYADAVDHSLVVTTSATDVPPAVLAWLRERAGHLLPPPGITLPHVDVDRQPIWYHIGGSVILFGWAADQWRHMPGHGGVWTALLVVAAGLLLFSGYSQHRAERGVIVYHDESPVD